MGADFHVEAPFQQGGVTVTLTTLQLLSPQHSLRLTKGELITSPFYSPFISSSSYLFLTINQWWAKLLRSLTVNSLSYFVKKIF